MTGKIHDEEFLKALAENMPAIAGTLTEIIKEEFPKGTQFSILVYNDCAGTLAGSEDLERSIFQLRRLVENHDDRNIRTDDGLENETKH